MDRLDVQADPARVNASGNYAWSGRGNVKFDAYVSDIGELARLAAAEQHCCSFFRFAITVDGRGVALEVAAPSDALDLVSALFGVAA